MYKKINFKTAVRKPHTCLLVITTIILIIIKCNNNNKKDVKVFNFLDTFNSNFRSIEGNWYLAVLFHIICYSKSLGAARVHPRLPPSAPCYTYEYDVKNQVYIFLKYLQIIFSLKFCSLRTFKRKETYIWWVNIHWEWMNHLSLITFWGP